jgi:hypothetical protein
MMASSGTKGVDRNSVIIQQACRCSKARIRWEFENHSLVKPANRKDYTVRMREFFDHHLRDMPAQAWLQKGVPHLQLDEHLEERVKELEE